MRKRWMDKKNMDGEREKRIDEDREREKERVDKTERIRIEWMDKREMDGWMEKER